jgi:hypothetical protein
MPFTITSYIPSVKPGAYQAVCTGVEERAPKAEPDNLFRVWSFQLTDGSLRMVEGSSSLATSPKSKGGKWVAALLGRTPEVGETFDPVGLPCTVIVAIKETTGYEYVETVAPPAVAQTAAPAPVAAPGPSETVVDPLAGDLPF